MTIKFNVRQGWLATYSRYGRPTVGVVVVDVRHDAPSNRGRVQAKLGIIRGNVT